MKCPVIAAAAALGCLVLTGCSSPNGGPPASFTAGFSGRTEEGQEYVLGLTIPLPTWPKKPAVPALPTGDGGGKSPVLFPPTQTPPPPK